MIKGTHQNRYIQTSNSFVEQDECTHCGGNGWIYEFYNDPVSWRSCPQCSSEKSG